MSSTVDLSSTSRSDPFRTSALAIAFALVLAAGTVVAQPKTGEAPPDGRAGPPPEALAACKTLKAGDTCSFNGRQGAASGTCVAPEGKAPACRPKDAPAPGAKAPKQ